MDTSIISEILKYVIPSALALVGVIVSVRAGNKETKAQIQEHTDLTLYRINQLEKKQDKYNNLQERMHDAETNIELAHEKIKVANHRIDDLEHIKSA